MKWNQPKYIEINVFMFIEEISILDFTLCGKPSNISCRFLWLAQKSLTLTTITDLYFLKCPCVHHIRNRISPSEIYYNNRSFNLYQGHNNEQTLVAFWQNFFTFTQGLWTCFDGWRTFQLRTFQPQASTPDLQPRTFQPQSKKELFNPGLFNNELLNPIFFNHELFKPVWKFMVETSWVEKFMVEKSGVERSGVEAWGWNVLQLPHTGGPKEFLNPTRWRWLW